MIERAKAGDATAMFAIGNAYYDELNYAMAIIWLRKSAANKNADAMNKLGFIYHSGYGVDVNFAIALEWFLKATKQGHTEAEVHVGNYHYYGIGIHVNKKAAISWYFNAAMKRHPEATERVAKTLVDENKKQSALLWYQKGMDLDNEDAKKGFDDLTRSNYHLDVDQKSKKGWMNTMMRPNNTSSH
jgi:TPR repeat protein